MKRIQNYALVLLSLLLFNVNDALASEVVYLTQTNCQFIEAENGLDHHFQSRSSDDCVRLNEKSADQRLAKAKVLRLKAGDYLFRVQNRDVSYALGFWLRGAGLSRLSLPGVSGGGIAMGQSRDYAVALVPGTYIYSCPLNPTPDYILHVE
ncbi:hypothetical protein [Mariprofundus sp. EBB-1]|uniref:hypothetical protein n=1 Tax=Mariprofundus sp. EBB-1 TaxID=2650971 RepID=UPI00191201E2|nr:hypothetical protein [Mariprofundus sp. EBB-1]